MVQIPILRRSHALTPPYRSMLYYLPLYYEAVKGYSPIITGVALFPETFTVAPASVIVGVTVSITGRYRWAIWAGWTFTTLGSGLLLLMNPGTSIVAWIFLNLVPGLGTGMLFSSIGMSVQAAIAIQDIAFGITFQAFFRSLGQALGIAIGGTIFQNEIHRKVSTYPLLAPMAAQYSQDATQLVSMIQAMPLGLARTQLIQAYADALKVIWAVMCGLSAVAGIASLFTHAYSLDQALQTEQGVMPDRRKKKSDAETGRKTRRVVDEGKE